jgi:hypothetical protein
MGGDGEKKEKTMNAIGTSALSKDTDHQALAPAFQFSEDDLAILLAGLPESARGREADCLAWWHGLPRLLAEGQQGRFALIQEGRLISIWDTYGDAMQAGYDKFGIDAHVLATEITQRELDKLHNFLAQQRGKACPK